MGEPRVKWNDETTKCFLLTCIEEVNKRGRKEASLYPESWARVGTVLKETCNIQVSQKQMKNLYDYLRPKYSGWAYLVGKTGNLYNPATNSFNMSRKEWDEFNKGHPLAKSLRTSNLPFPDLCRALFDGSCATGERQWTPSSSHPRPRDSSSSVTPTTQLLQLGIHSETQESGFRNSPPPSETTGTFTPTTSIPRSGGGGRKASNLEEDRPTKKTKRSITQIEEDMSTALKLIVKNNDGPTYDECVDKLNDLGWDAACSLYVAALGVFCEAPSYRKGWMSLPIDNVELLKSWVTSVASKLGFPV